MRSIEREEPTEEMVAEDRSRVLVVDDDPILLAVARRGLSKKYEVLDAPNGAAALWIASLNKPDLVILDLDLPDMAGHELMKRLREAVGCTAPVIVLTGSVRDADELAYLRAGVDDFLRKPYDMERLHARIDNILHRTTTAYVPAAVVVDVVPDPVPAGSHFSNGDVFVWTSGQDS